MNLTQVATITRRGIVTLAALLILGIIATVGYRIWYDYYIASLPPKEELPNYKLGWPLPKINFPSVNVSTSSATPSTSNYSYSIDTPTGNFGNFPKITTVYFMPRANIVSLTSFDGAQKLAEKLGFNNGREILSTTSYKFYDKKEGYMIIDLLTGNFYFQKKLPDKNLTTPLFSNQNSLIEYFKNYLKENNLLTADLAGGRSKVVYKKSANNINYAIVSLWPTNWNELPIVNPYTNTSNLRAEIAVEDISTKDNPDKAALGVFKLFYTYWPIDQNTNGTYPLKTVDQAFSDLENGEGFVSLASKSPRVSLTSASMAYYQSTDYSPYLLPVYVFDGVEFSAIVSAIKDE